MKESAWFEIWEASARFWSTRFGLMPRESFLRKREKGVENRKAAIGRAALCNSELNVGG